MVSQTLSGWPSPTDSEAKMKRRSMGLWIVASGEGLKSCSVEEKETVVALQPFNFFMISTY
jgi:hypothetical protein